MNLSWSSDWKTLVQDFFLTSEWIFFLRNFISSLSIHHVRREDLDETLDDPISSVEITVEDFRIFLRRDLTNAHESIRSQLHIQIKYARPSVSQEYRDWRWWQRISRSRVLTDLIEDRLRFTLRNFQYSHDVNRSEDTRSCEINMNGRINDIDSVRWRVSVVICIMFDEHRFADLLLIVTLRIYSSVLILIRRTLSVCLPEMMSIRKESPMSTWTLRDRRTPSWQWFRSSGIDDLLFAFHIRGLTGRFTNSRSRVKFEWSDPRESTDQKRKFSSYNESIYFSVRIYMCICSIKASEENDRIISRIIV